MSLRVLAVDDSRTMRDLIRHSLEVAKLRVFTAEDGVDGIDKLKEANPDVIITDINMPRLDGFGFIKAVRSGAHCRAVPILVLSTESDPAMKEQARRGGATGWIVKPFDAEQLLAAVRRVSAGSEQA